MRKRFFVLSAAVLFLGAARGWAEPYLAAWKGVNCNACHVNQTGGWLRNDFGKNYGNTLQTFDWQGIAEEAQKIQHNTPSFIAIGIDIHQGFLTTKDYNPAGNTSLFLGGGSASPLSRQDFSFQVKANEVMSGVFTSRLDENGGFVKEAYGLVSGLPANGYLKFGNFLLPYGLTLSDDGSLIRGPLGFAFDSNQIGGIEAGIYPDVFFLNAALTNGDITPMVLPSGQIIKNEMIFSAKGGASFRDFTVGLSLYGANLDEPGGTTTAVATSDAKLLYNGFGWGRIGPVVLLAEYDKGYYEQSEAVGIARDDLSVYHISAEVDLGHDVYLRLASEKFDDSLKQNGSDGLRQVLTIRCYPVRNLRAQIDFQRMDPAIAVNQPNYALLADAFVFY